MIALARSEATKLLSARSTPVLAGISILGTLPMASANSVSAADLDADSELLFLSAPIPPEFQGFEMAGFGYVLVVVLAALWAGSEYGDGKQIRTTLLATPGRLRVFFTKAALLAVLVAAIAFTTMTGAIMITHATGHTGVAPWPLTPAIWLNLGGVTLAWTLTALIAFALGTLARTMILPLILIVPLIIGVGDFLAGLWDGAKYLPTVAGAAMYTEADAIALPPATGGLVQGAWAVALLGVAAVVFSRRDV